MAPWGLAQGNSLCASVEQGRAYGDQFSASWEGAG